MSTIRPTSFDVTRMTASHARTAGYLGAAPGLAAPNRMIGDFMNKQRRTRRWSAGGAAVLSIGSMLALATPAPASTERAAAAALTINFVVCAEVEGNLIECDISVGGGVQPYSYRWSSTTEDSDDVAFECFSAGPATFTESVTVTDAAHATASTTRPYFCPGNAAR
ncbi:MAG TPA: hypothetical protein VH333_24290 [Pseudonocardiaceae bacterium]|jgi:hypothetical protein|nr:hypothetical protein [Pseudonocardiaceae bacterium]